MTVPSLVFSPEALDRLRKRDDLSLTQLAASCGVSENTARAWVNGKREPTVVAVATMADSFGVKLEALFKRNPEAAT